MDLKMAFGLVLKEIREDRQVSQEALALAAGLDRTYISLLERGHRQPTLGSLFALAGALEVAPRTMVARVEKHLRFRR